MKNIKYVTLILFTFLFIYFPPIVFVNILHVLAGVSWVFIFLNRRCFLKLINESKYIRELLFFSFVLFFLYFMLLINGSSNIIIGYNIIMILFEALPISHVIVYLFNESKSNRNFYDLIVHVGVLQGLLAILAFILPQFQFWVINRMLNYGFRDIIVWMSNHRMYGFGYNFAYSMPIVQSVIACLSIYLAIKKKLTYLIYTPILIFSGIINARISVIILLLGVTLIFLDTLLNIFKAKYKIVVVILAILVFYNPTLQYIEEKSPATYAWLVDGGSEIINLRHRNMTGSYTTYITNPDIYKFPDGLHLLFGTSERVIRGNLLHQSDVGFVNDIWFGGLIYCFLIYSYLVTKLITIKKKFNMYSYNGTLFCIFLLTVLIASNFKGTIFALNEFINLFYLIYIYSLSLDSSNRKHGTITGGNYG